MKKSQTKNKTHRVLKRKRGFTLTETVVTMGVFSLLLPPVLLMDLHLARQAAAGVEHNSAINNARLIQQHFITIVNSSENFLPKDNGNYLELKMYDPNTSNWVNNALCFSPSENTFKLFEAGSDGTLSVTKTFSSRAYRSNSNQVFSAVGNLVRLQLCIDESPLERGESGNTGTYIDVITSPRNAGRNQ